MSKTSNYKVIIVILSFLSCTPTIESLSLSPLYDAANVISNAICERTPTHLLCNTSVAAGHKILQQLPAVVTIRPCSVFLASPHCCGQFCLPGAGGICDVDTGACFCNPSGPPKVCQALVQTDNSSTVMNDNDRGVLDICRDKCKANPNGCTRPAATTDGIVGTVCMCYCD